MAPELAFGQAKQATTAADVWSLGVILYQLLTAQLPFDAAAPLEVTRLVVQTEPRRPRLLNTRVDRDLETICLRCLEKDPTRRYDSAAMLADDLARWLRHEPIQARPNSVFGRTRKWVKRRPALAALIAVTLAAVALIFTLTLLNKAQLKRERDKAIELQQRAESEARAAELRRAEGLLREGEALAANNRFAEAKNTLHQSRDISLATKTSALPP
jgi:serine/threonine-protein kinase